MPIISGKGVRGAVYQLDVNKLDAIMRRQGITNHELSAKMYRHSNCIYNNKAKARHGIRFKFSTIKDIADTLGVDATDIITKAKGG